jgi:phenylacetate-CoA ligase
MIKALSKKNVWEKTPHLLKSTLGRGLGLFPLEWLLGRSFRTNSKFVRDAQWWSAERTREYQLERLRSVCGLAYSKSRFYHRAFEAAGFHPDALKTVDDLAVLPTIDRHTIQKHAGEMCTRPASKRSVDLCTSGGTSGTQLAFYMDHDRSFVEYAYLVASWGRTGYSFGMPMAVLRAYTPKPNRKNFHHEYDPLLNHHYYSSFHMTDGNMRRYLEHIATIGPCFLHVYPSTVSSLSRFLRRSGMHAPTNILGIIAESENVYPDQRADIEEVFGVRMFSCYGHSEKLVLAAECENSTDYHVWPTYGYLELLDDDGNPVTTPGQRGESVGTGFISTVMPFIRYRTSDYATYVGNRCEACGREHIVLRDIRGHRIQEVLIAADGSAMPWSGLEPWTGVGVGRGQKAFIHVRQLQFYQDTPGRAVLRIVPAEGFGDESRRAVRKFFEWKCDGAIDFTVELTDSIALSPRGKAIYVDQRIEQYRNRS